MANAQPLLQNVSLAFVSFFLLFFFRIELLFGGRGFRERGFRLFRQGRRLKEGMDSLKGIKGRGETLAPKVVRLGTLASRWCLVNARVKRLTGGHVGVSSFWELGSFLPEFASPPKLQKPPPPQGSRVSPSALSRHPISWGVDNGMQLRSLPSSDYLGMLQL